MLRIRLVGGVAVEVGDRTLPAPASRRAWALLAWLALHPGLHSRADVAARLWPDVIDSSARRSMRSALWSLRQVLDRGGTELIITTRDRVGLPSDTEVDVLRFGDCLAAGRLAEAVSIGDGDLLTGVDDEWALAAREAHRERLVSALGALARSADDPIAALQWARRASALDPLSEEAARTLMECLAASGDRPAALAAYQRLAGRLRRELHVAPSEPTWRLAEQIRTGSQTPAPAPPTGTTSRRASAGAPPMIGRRAELAALREAWSATASGSGGFATVHGDAGIGKTRLAGELAELARRGGGMVAVGAPPDLAAEALTPWVEVCASLVDQLGGLPDAPWVDSLASLVPTVVPSPGRAGTPPDLEQTRLAESVVALLEACAATGPVLVVLEDLHVADEASLAVLAHVARRASERRVLLVGTRRERPLRDRLAALEQSHRQRGTLRADIALGPLDERAVSRLARSVGELSDEAVDQVIDVADGNALLAVEVARALAAGDPLPLGLRGATRAALARLPEPARTLVATLAVAGRDLDAREAALRADVDLAAALPPAEDQGLLVSVGGRVGFRHALLRESVYADMPAVERADRHERAAALLQAGTSHARTAEAASHLQAIGQLGEAGQLLIQAAVRARALGALADATTLLRAASEALPEDPTPALELADVLAWRGRVADARAAFARALPLLETSADPHVVAHAHLRFAEWHYGPICQPAVALVACRRALAVLDGAGLPAVELRSQVLSVYAWCTAIAGTPEDIAQAIGLLTALVGDEPSDPLLRSGLDRTRSFAFLRQGKFTEAIVPALRSAEVSQQLGRADLTYAALVNAAFGQAASGDLDAALSLLDQAAVALSGHGMLAIEALVLVYRAWVLVRLGRVSEAAEAASLARRTADRLDAPDLQAIVDAERGRVAMRAGEYEAAAALLGSALGMPDASIGRPLARLQRAEALARAGRLDDAETELAEVVLEPVREGDWPETLVLRMANVEGLVAAGRGDVDLARRRLGEAVSGWRRLTPEDLSSRLASVMVDLGRPIIGLVLPVEELAAAEADLATLTAVMEV
jgi:DNA-binding SARP family transcriptional activator/tetratricopeptide (TPR) repeat protein